MTRDVGDKLQERSKIKIEISKQNILWIFRASSFINERYQCCVVHNSFNEVRLRALMLGRSKQSI